MSALMSAKKMQGCKLDAQDGSIGQSKDFLFDSERWVVRYLVADTRKWLPGRKVLISPISIGKADGTTRTLQIHLTKERIQEAPPLDEDAPVSRQYEITFNRYHDWGHYWGGESVWGAHAFPHLLRKSSGEPKVPAPTASDNDPNLRSAEEVTGYRIKATDDHIGHGEDFIVDTDSWIIRYLVLDTSDWLPASRKVLIAPDWVRKVVWVDNQVEVNLTKEQVKDSPEFHPAQPVNREYEITLYDFYGRPYYW
ncbi:MAG: hypothetical protein P8010_04290 [Desulfosarcinaceae bacterium]